MPVVINYLAANSLSIYCPKVSKEFTLLPGLNLDVSDAAWNEISTHPLVRMYQELNTIVVVRSAPEVKTEFKAEKTVVEVAEIKGIDELVPVNKPASRAKKA